MKRLITLFSLIGGLALPAHAITIFTTSVGTQPANVGTITLTQVDADTVNVSVDLLDGYGFMNSGGPHTPFAFTLAGTESGVSASFLTPAGGTYAVGLDNYQFSLSTTDGGATPYGTYGISINSTAPKGSGSAYYGDLSIDVTRTSGLLESDFIANSLGYYFAADLTDGTNTGSQAWATKSTSVPDGGMTAVLLGLGLVGLSFIARRRAA